ncbi:muropeptide transporter [bacterium BMS3Abin03]|nr:muropeptide transporter [bacterium BMS3Abin03]
MIKKEKRNPWFWVPSLYVAEGLPYVMVMAVSAIMYKRLNISNTEVALYTSWLYLPWVIKPLWSPFVDLFRTKRFWILTMQFLIGAGLAGVALTVPADNFFRYTLAFFWLMAFSSATHDIAADGFYMIALDDHQQAWFVGIRTLFYRIAFIFAQGLLVIFAGYLEETTGDISYAWKITFFILAALFLIFFIYHLFVLPHPKQDSERKEKDYKAFLLDYFKTFAIFFKKEKILIIIGFIILYRLGEGQLSKLASLFLLDSIEKGGLALTTSQVGLVYGTVGWIALSLGGILGGIAVAKQGLKFWIWWMLIAINLPDVVYIFLAYTQTTNLFLINVCIAIEQFGYGFGFAAFLLYLIFISEGKFKTTHYAIATAFMALGNMLPGMISGWLEDSVGYKLFFVLVLISTIPSFIITKFIPLDSEFGKKKKTING